MSVSETTYTARIPFPEAIERGRTQVVKLEVYRNGALRAPSSGTLTIYDQTDTAVIDAEAITITDSIAQYTVSAASIPASTPVAEGWRMEWTLVMPDGVTHTFRRTCSLVLRRLYPVVTDADLLAIYTDLTDLRPSGISSFQGYIDEAWRQVLGRLINKGSMPYLILDPWSLREVTLDTTLSLIFRDFASSMGEGRYLELAESHKREAAFAWKGLTLTYDEDHDGKADGKARKAANPVVYLSNPPRTRWGW